MPDVDKLSLMEDARREALEDIIAANREAKAEIVRPAIGRKLPKAARLAAQRMFLSDPETSALAYAELEARYQLSDERPIPRRFVTRAIQATREVRKADAEADDVQR